MKQIKKKSIGMIKKTLDSYVDFSGETIDADIISLLVDKITPNEDGVFKWYLNLEECCMRKACSMNIFMLRLIVLR